jgi:hypothetical protein
MDENRKEHCLSELNLSNRLLNAIEHHRIWCGNHDRLPKAGAHPIETIQDLLRVFEDDLHTKTSSAHLE